MYIIISLSLIALSLFLINFGRIDKFRNEKKRTFDFLLSLVSTFTGLFIALSVNTILGNITQKQNLVKLLNTSNLAIESCAQRTQGAYINIADKGASLSEIVKNTPVELPRLYQSLETNALVNDYFSGNAFKAYILCMDQLQYCLKNINGETTTDPKRLEAMKLYITYLKKAQQVNQIEIDKLNKNISTNTETEKLSQLNNN